MTPRSRPEAGSVSTGRCHTEAGAGSVATGWWCCRAVAGRAASAGASFRSAAALAGLADAAAAFFPSATWLLATEAEMLRDSSFGLRCAGGGGSVGVARSDSAASEVVDASQVYVYAYV